VNTLIKSNGPRGQHSIDAEGLRIAVHVQADVLEPDSARRRGDRWLLQDVCNLLRAETPELLLGECLLWRFLID
jgi:hypothetical protein